MSILSSLSWADIGVIVGFLTVFGGAIAYIVRSSTANKEKIRAIFSHLDRDHADIQGLQDRYISRDEFRTQIKTIIELLNKSKPEKKEIDDVFKSLRK